MKEKERIKDREERGLFLGDKREERERENKRKEKEYTVFRVGRRTRKRMRRKERNSWLLIRVLSGILLSRPVMRKYD